MKRFSDLNITIADGPFTGKKKEMDELFDQEIEIHDYRVVDSKFPKPGCEKCLHMQIAIDGKKYVAFCSSKNLIRNLDQIVKEDFPIVTTIRKDGKKFIFT